jgi:hypothetical protein
MFFPSADETAEFFFLFISEKTVPLPRLLGVVAL